MMCNGTLYPLPRLVQAIAVNGSGYLLPTPTASTGGAEPPGKTGRKLITVLKNHMLPTLIARDWKDTPGMAKQAGDRQRTDTLPRSIFDREKSPPRSGIINPKFSLWLMGYPANWLEIN